MSQPPCATATPCVSVSDATGAALPSSLQDPPPSVPPRIVDQAIDWMVKLDFSEADPSARTRFEAWIAADPMHALAWQRVRAVRDDFARMPGSLALQTLQSADARRGIRGMKRRQAVKVLSFAGVSLVAAAGVRELAPWPRMLADMSTGTGEQRTVRLGDGTVVILNTDTAIDVDFSAGRRLVTLRRGEILIGTGRDDVAAHGIPTRPFWVQTPSGSLRALGTRFLVRSEAAHVRVSVQEGAVELVPATSGAQRVARAGSDWWLGSDGSVPAPPLPFEATGWADGVISGNGMRLGDVLAELERYRRGRIVCDPRVADLRISGSYRVQDTDQVLRFLAQTQPVTLTYRTRWWVAVGPADPH